VTAVVILLAIALVLALARRRTSGPSGVFVIDGVMDPEASPPSASLSPPPDYED
jgi:hypothetical protein